MAGRRTVTSDSLPKMASKSAAKAEREEPSLQGVELSQNMFILKNLRNFLEYDVNGDGVISYQEMKAILKQSTVNFTERDLRTVLKQADRDGDGSVCFDEYLELAQKLSEIQNKTKVKTSRIARAYLDPILFAQYVTVFESAAGEDGTVDLAELQELMQKHNLKVNEDRLKYVMKEFDENDSGTLELDEFLILLVKGLGVKKRKVGPDHCPASQLREEGWVIGELKRANYDCASLREAGFTPAQLMDVCTARELLNGGVPARQLLAAGWDCKGAREIVLDIDRDAGCCRVALDQDPSNVPVKVAIRHLAPDLDTNTAATRLTQEKVDLRTDQALAEAIEACAQATSSLCSSTAREAMRQTGGTYHQDMAQLREDLGRRLTRLEQRIEAMDEAMLRGERQDPGFREASCGSKENIQQKVVKDLKSQLDQRLTHLASQVEDVARSQCALQADLQSLASKVQRPMDAGDYDMALRKLTSNMEDIRSLIASPVSPRRGSRASSPSGPAGHPGPPGGLGSTAVQSRPCREAHEARPQPASPNAAVACAKCGSAFAADANFCRRCGAPRPGAPGAPGGWPQVAQVTTSPCLVDGSHASLGSFQWQMR